MGTSVAHEGRLWISQGLCQTCPLTCSMKKNARAVRACSWANTLRGHELIESLCPWCCGHRHGRGDRDGRVASKTVHRRFFVGWRRAARKTFECFVLVAPCARRVWLSWPSSNPGAQVCSCFSRLRGVRAFLLFHGAVAGACPLGTRPKRLVDWLATAGLF